jgi:hypothetical protein
MWLEQVLPKVRTISLGFDLTPIQQVDALFHDFVSGADLSYYERSHQMLPVDQGVWELKTLDVRIFGWFPLRAAFIIANIDTMERVKTHRLYSGYRDDCIRRRDTLDLEHPKYLSGTDVL